MNSKRTARNQKKTILTFENILERENYVICDTSIASGRSDWYGRYIHSINRFSELALAPTEKQIEYIKSFLSLLAHPKTFVVTGVSREIINVVDILEDKIKDLSKIKRIRKDARAECPEEDKLKEVYKLFNELYIKSRGSRFSPRQKQTYSFLEKIVLSVTEHTQAKKDYDEVYHPNRRPKNVEDFHTDEELVATALYLSVVEGKSGGILTRDSDIKRILFNTLSYLSYYNRVEYREILDSTLKNRIEIYYATGIGEARLDYSSSQFNPNKSCKEIPPDKLEIIDSQINPLNQLITQI